MSGPNPQFNSNTEPMDRGLAGHKPLVTGSGILITGQNLVKYAVLGQITASGKWNLSLSGAADGSEVPRAILANDYDATAADIADVVFYLEGEFDDSEITLGAAHTVASVKSALAEKGIHLRSTVLA